MASGRNWTPFQIELLNASKSANITGDFIHALRSVFDLCIPEKISENFPYASTDFVAIRTIAWSSLIYGHKPAAQFLRPVDMSPSHSELCSVIVNLTQFFENPSESTFVLAANSFDQFTTKYWAMRPTFLKFLALHCSQNDKHFNPGSYLRFHIHMISLIDGDFSRRPNNEWEPVQFLHALNIFKLPTDGSAMPRLFSHMKPMPVSLIQETLGPFAGEPMPALCCLQNYIYFLSANHINKHQVEELIASLRREGDGKSRDFLETIARRVLIALADPASPHHAKVVQLSQSFVLERYYEDIIRCEFEKEVQCIPCIRATDILAARGAVRLHWELFPPQLIRHLSRLHVFLWGDYYNSII